MEMKKLNFLQTLQEALAIGIKNAPSIVGAIALWLVTIWIPYINIGTTIAVCLLPLELAKGNVINPLGIFDAKYRRYMGEYFITMGLMIFPILIATAFMVVPGIVLSLAWSLAYFFLIDKNKNPMQAIKASNDATYGSKWTMFFIILAFVIALYIIGGIIGVICALIGSGFLTVVVMAALFILAVSISMAVEASIWKQLKDNVE